MATPLHIAIAGCAGRMGKTLLHLTAENTELKLVAASVAPGSDAAGKEIAAGVTATDDPGSLFTTADAVIDFTTPESTLALAALAAKSGRIHIVGTTGFTEAQKKQLRSYADKAVIVYSANMSLGVNLLAGLVEQAARALGDAYSIDIFDHHHQHKKDAPSGTALMLGEASTRPHGTIHYTSERSGEVIGDHRVTFTGPGESLTLSHHAATRDIFAAGALKAALWARGKSPGFYSLRDVLGI